MIAFRYTKTDGAEFISHLDTLRHIDRTLRRAGIEVKKSEGFNKHPRIYMNNPLATGVKSVAEYCTVDCEYDGDFAKVFCENSPKGIKCLAFRQTPVNCNYVNTITRCEYEAEGIADFNPAAILREKEIIITDSRGRTVDIRPRIYAVERCGGVTKFVLGCGENNLRPDLFCGFLTSRFGGAAKNIIKTKSFGEYVF